MDKNEIVYVIAYKDSEMSDKESWDTGDFEPYDYYNTAKEAHETAVKLRSELKAQKRTDVKVFIHKAFRSWCERNF